MLNSSGYTTRVSLGSIPVLWAKDILLSAMLIYNNMFFDHILVTDMFHMAKNTNVSSKLTLI